MNSRDMSEREFVAACARNGITVDPLALLGFCDIGRGHHVSRYNGGSSRRAQLAYLIERKAEADAQHGAEEQLDAAERVALACGAPKQARTKNGWGQFGVAGVRGVFEWEPRTWAVVVDGCVQHANYETRREANRGLVRAIASEAEHARKQREADERRAARVAAGKAVNR